VFNATKRRHLFRLLSFTKRLHADPVSAWNALEMLIIQELHQILDRDQMLFVYKVPPAIAVIGDI
jgi:hypothetical protein